MAALRYRHAPCYRNVFNCGGSSCQRLLLLLLPRRRMCSGGRGAAAIAASTAKNLLFIISQQTCTGAGRQWHTRLRLREWLLRLLLLLASWLGRRLESLRLGAVGHQELNQLLHSVHAHCKTAGGGGLQACAADENKCQHCK